jgi:hypothetical protein
MKSVPPPVLWQLKLVQRLGTRVRMAACSTTVVFDQPLDMRSACSST